MGLKQREVYIPYRPSTAELEKSKRLQEEWLKNNKPKVITYDEKKGNYKIDGEDIEEKRPEFTQDAGGIR